MPRISKTDPAFFKVLINKDFTKLLSVPPAFTRKYNLKESKNVKLREVNSGRRWSVELERVKNKGPLSFTHGWEKFVEEAALCFGEFIFFYLVRRDSQFDVMVYRTNFCEREIPPPPPPAAAAITLCTQPQEDNSCCECE